MGRRATWYDPVARTSQAAGRATRSGATVDRDDPLILDRGSSADLLGRPMDELPTHILIESARRSLIFIPYTLGPSYRILKYSDGSMGSSTSAGGGHRVCPSRSDHHQAVDPVPKSQHTWLHPNYMS